MKTYELSRLMSRAWAIRRATRTSMSNALKKAWELNRLSERLHKSEVCMIAYRKVDGSIRYALATLKDTERFVSGRGRTESPKVFTYWDVEKCDWRCFKVESLLSWM